MFPDLVVKSCQCLKVIAFHLIRLSKEVTANSLYRWLLRHICRPVWMDCSNSNLLPLS